MNRFLALPAALLMAMTPAFAGKIVIKGSDTLGAKYVPQLAEAFKAKHPETSFEIAAEGSTTGISAIIEGSAQIGMSSRKVEPTEESTAKAKGVVFKETVVVHDAIAVLVNEKSPIKKLTKKQVEQIFTGDVTDWSAVGGTPGPISIYTRNTSSGTYKDFKALAMKKRDYAASAQKLAGNEQIAAEVGKNAAGTGYVGLAYTKGPGIKVMPIDGVEITDETVRSGKYPFSRETYFYTNGEAQGETKAFIDFTLSEEGQKIGRQVGFVPIK
ncbi:MAG: phosphate transport system substrate-binding protein [Chthoniobacter sp.]|jgi:phosphate transport system substrate-binding protein|nr:phosphate transport system substrate-binding protein [Chthoniobacter sp.]